MQQTSVILRFGGLERRLPPGMRVLLGEAWRTWRWAERNVWMLASLMAVVHAEAGFGSTTDTGIGSSKSPLQDQPEMNLAVDSAVVSVLSLFCIFVVGVSIGHSWKAIQRATGGTSVAAAATAMEVVAATTASEPGPPIPTTTSTTITNSSPRLYRTSTVGAVKEYTLKEIIAMTDGFRSELGRGGQGVVYSATSLPDEPLPRKLAVKRLQNGSTVLLHNIENRPQEVVEKEFWAELNTISRLHHRNLVALLGFCVEDDDLFLVYEYMARGSLDQLLHPRIFDGAPVLTWKQRMRCAAEVAQGLEYLHSHAEPSLVHRDVKSANILFDEDMQAKIADFGLSKPLPTGHQPTVSTRVRGTHGYVDPVYVFNGFPCDKNDVYSYGVVLLELITGRRHIQQGVPLVVWCKDYFREETVMRHLVPNMVDMRIHRHEFAVEQLYDVVRVAQMCVEDRQEKRPSMKDVVVRLHYANCKDYSSSGTSSPETTPRTTPRTTLSLTVSQGSNFSSFADRLRQPVPAPLFLQPHPHPPPALTRATSGLPSYEIREGEIVVKCTVGNNQKIALRCKIWPTPKNVGMNKVEATLNGAFLWKKGLWIYNGKGSREFTIDDDITLTAEWHVGLRVPTVLNRHALPSADPRRHQGPFCVYYLALRQNDDTLIAYKGDKEPVPDNLSRESTEPRSPRESTQPRPTREIQRLNNYPIRLRSGTSATSAHRHSSFTARRATNTRHSALAH